AQALQVDRPPRELDAVRAGPTPAALRRGDRLAQRDGVPPGEPGLLARQAAPVEPAHLGIHRPRRRRSQQVAEPRAAGEISAPVDRVAEQENAKARRARRTRRRREEASPASRLFAFFAFFAFFAPSRSFCRYFASAALILAGGSLAG